MFGAFTVFTSSAASNATDSDSKAEAALRQSPVASSAVRAAELCRADNARVKWPTRCMGTRSGGGVLRQYTRQPPIGWGGASSNMATIIGNSSLSNTNFSIDVLIETPAQGYVPSAAPYVLVGLHGGNGQIGGSAPGSFYRTGPDFDFVWFQAGKPAGEHLLC